MKGRVSALTLEEVVRSYKVPALTHPTRTNTFVIPGSCYNLLPYLPQTYAEKWEGIKHSEVTAYDITWKYWVTSMLKFLYRRYEIFWQPLSGWLLCRSSFKLRWDSIVEFCELRWPSSLSLGISTSYSAKSIRYRLSATIDDRIAIFRVFPSFLPSSSIYSTLRCSKSNVYIVWIFFHPNEFSSVQYNNIYKLICLCWLQIESTNQTNIQILRKIVILLRLDIYGGM